MSISMEARRLSGYHIGETVEGVMPKDLGAAVHFGGTLIAVCHHANGVTTIGLEAKGATADFDIAHSHLVPVTSLPAP